MRLTTPEARFRADSPATLPCVGLSTYGQTQGCDFYFLKHERKYLGRHTSQQEILIPSGAAFGSACLFAPSLCLPFSPAPLVVSFWSPSPFISTTGSRRQRGGEGSSPGSVWGGPLIAQRPAFAPGIQSNQGFPGPWRSWLAGCGLQLHVLF